MKIVNVTDGGVTAKLTVRRANIADSLRKGMLVNDALKNPLADPVDQIVQSVIYPRCLACLVTGTIETPADGEHPAIVQDAKTMSAADFVALPEAIGDAWLDAVLELNPSWDFSEQDPEKREDGKKKG